VADPEGSQGGPDGPSASNRAPTATAPTRNAEVPTAARDGESETQIGGYQVLGRLGAGGQADVWLAFDSRIKRHVAIKRIRADGQMSPHARERLRREAAAAATVSHPSVVQIYGMLADPSGEAIVMEYVEGHTLHEMLARGPLPAHQAILIARQVAEGLAASHAKGLIHRDLKTQNVG
jgi:serine/threonine-protein kinase